jgi:AsmA protein
MKKIIIGIIVLIVLLIAGLIALPSLIPSSVYKENIETQLSRELAREVRVQGDVKLSVFPVIKANTGRVEIDNPDGFILKARRNFIFHAKEPLYQFRKTRKRRDELGLW